MNYSLFKRPGRAVLELMRSMAPANDSDTGAAWMSGAARLAGLFTRWGCVRQPLSPDYAGPQPRPPVWIDRCRFEGLPESPTVDQLLDQSASFTVRAMTVALKNRYSNRFHLRFYEPAAAGRFPLLIISTILDDPGEVLARMVARHFVRHRYNCAIITRGVGKLNQRVPLEEIEPWQLSILRDYAGAKAVLCRQPKVDPDRLATFGISYGALNNALLAGTDDSYRAHVIALAGGPLSEVIAQSREQRIRQFVREYCQKHQCTPETFIRQWEGLEVDPLKVAPYVDARKVLLVLSRFDRVVPYATGQQLSRAMGGPETLLLMAGHYSAIAFIGYLLGESRRFLGVKLGVNR